MPKWSNIKLTNQGRLLYARAMAGEKLTITNVRMGSGTPGAIESMTALVAAKQTLNIAEVRYKDSTCIINANINNTGLTQGYNAAELGVFAKIGNGQEILYAVTVDSEPDYIPTAAVNPVNLAYELHIKIDNFSADINIAVNNNGVATIEQMERAIANSGHARSVNGIAAQAGNVALPIALEIDVDAFIGVNYNTPTGTSDFATEAQLDQLKNSFVALSEGEVIAMFD